MEAKRSEPRDGCNRGRRQALRNGALLGVLIAAGEAGRGLAAEAPKETGLSYEGLLSKQSGFQPRKPAPLPISEIPGFLSKAQLARSYSVYRDAFARLLEAEGSLEQVPHDRDHASEYAELRRQQVGSANSVLLHEFYFRNLALQSVDPPRLVRNNMSEHMGTMDVWRADFIACGRVAEAWAVLIYDPYDDRWHNLPLGHMDAGGMVGANPLVVCDVSEDAWSFDYDGRDGFLDGFLTHLDWNVVADRYRAVDRH